ncbi:hypothetical protein CN181_30835, partial [Sinorhizobium medicae]
SAISNHPVPLLSMTELISRSQSAKARWAVRSAHDRTGASASLRRGSDGSFDMERLDPTLYFAPSHM